MSMRATSLRALSRVTLCQGLCPPLKWSLSGYFLWQKTHMGSVCACTLLHLRCNSVAILFVYTVFRVFLYGVCVFRACVVLHVSRVGPCVHI